MAGVILIAIGFLRLGTYHQVHPLPGHHRLHRRHRRHHLRQPDHGPARARRSPHEPAEFVPKLAALWDAAATVDPADRRRAAPVAGHRSSPCAAGARRWPGFLIARRAAPRSRPCCCSSMSPPSAPASAASRRRLPAPSLPDVHLAKMQPRLPDALRHRAARRHRIAALGGGRRRHDRAAASLQLRAGGAGRRQHRLGDVRRHLRHRHHRPHRHQRPRRRRAARSPACCTPPILLLFMLCAAPLAAYIPLAALGAVLLVVAWNMAEKSEFIALILRARAATPSCCWRPSC